VIVAIWTVAGEGEGFKKEVVSRSRKLLPNLRILGNRQKKRSRNEPFHNQTYREA
jgi:hypothetical protein